MKTKEQMEMNRLISRLLHSRFKDFRIVLQGGETAKTLVITSGNKRIIGRIHHYLVNVLDLIIRDGTKKHGNGGNFTRLITLSEISVETANKIKHKAYLLSKKELKKKKVIIAEKLVKPIIPTPVSVIENGPPKKTKLVFLKATEYKKDYNLYSLFSSIERMLKFEGIRENTFDCEKTQDDKYLVWCDSLRITDMIHSLLNWIAGDPDLVKRENEFITIDYLKRIKKEKILARAIFCLPPQDHFELEEVERRLKRVSPGSRPSIKVTEDRNGFLISYRNKNFVKRICSILASMDWRILVKDENSFIIITDEGKKPAPSIVEKNNKVAEDTQSSATNTNRDDFDLKVSQNQFVDPFKTRGDVIAKLKELHQDSVLFDKISPETQRKIIAVLTEDFKRNNPEGYALKLLSLIDM